MVYQPNIPIGTTQLDVDYANIQGNFQQLDTSFGIDHVPFSQSLNNGYHNVIHFVPISSNPPMAITGIGQLYSFIVNDGENSDTALYFESGKGIVSRLTGNFSATDSTNGYAYIGGGLILQWGVKSGTPFSVTFATSGIAFPNNCFNVQTSSLSPPISAGVYVNPVTINRTGFTYASNVSSSFNWVAIGN